MRNDDLTAFLAVAEDLHFGRAATRLHIAQPPLSRAIARLEGDIGARLFERSTRSVRLTAAGSALVEPAQRVLSAIRDARHAVEAADRGNTGTVRMAFGGPSSYAFVGRLGRAVRERYPGIDLKLTSALYGPAALNAVAVGELDAAILRADVIPAGLSDLILSEERYMIATSIDHRLSGRETVSIEECRDEPFVALPPKPGSSPRDALFRFARAAGFTPNVVQTAPDSLTVLALAAAGVGISLTVDAVLGETQPGLTVIPIVEAQEPTYSRLVWRTDDRNPALRSILSTARRALDGQP